MPIYLKNAHALVLSAKMHSHVHQSSKTLPSYDTVIPKTILVVNFFLVVMRVVCVVSA